MSTITNIGEAAAALQHRLDTIKKADATLFDEMASRLAAIDEAVEAMRQFLAECTEDKGKAIDAAIGEPEPMREAAE